jgi:hypothetical protein
MLSGTLLKIWATPAPAAKACDDLAAGGKTDWFLPSQDELNQLYINRFSVGNLGTSYYYSSSQAILLDSAWAHGFGDGVQGNASKQYPYSVRAIRAF